VATNTGVKEEKSRGIQTKTSKQVRTTKKNEKLRRLMAEKVEKTTKRLEAKDAAKAFQRIRKEQQLRLKAQLG